MAGAGGRLGDGRSLLSQERGSGGTGAFLPLAPSSGRYPAVGRRPRCALQWGALPWGIAIWDAQGAGRLGWPLLSLPGMGRFHSQGAKNKLEAEPPATLSRNGGVGGRGPFGLGSKKGIWWWGVGDPQFFVCAFLNPGDLFQGIASLFCWGPRFHSTMW